MVFNINITYNFRGIRIELKGLKILKPKLNGMDHHIFKIIFVRITCCYEEYEKDTIFNEWVQSFNNLILNMHSKNILNGKPCFAVHS